MERKTNHLRWLLAVLFLTLPVQAKYGGGTGEPNDPYLIYTAEQMNEIGLQEEDWDKQFKLMADIDLSAFTSDQFNIIGGNPPFTGVFDGDGHTISNFTYVSTDLFAGGGFFGSVNEPNAEIKNLRLIDPNVVAEDGGGVGLLIACLSQGIISNCHVENGHVAGFMSVGGLVGVISGDVQITPPGESGGRESVVVVRRGEGILRYCSTNGVYVSGNSKVGGLVGSHERGTITHCHSTGTVVGNELVGGLVGENFDTISACFSTARVTGIGLVGGLVGYNSRSYDADWSDGRIMHCCSSGSVSGDWVVGGLVGMNSTWISNCYSVGSVTGTTGVGGLIGSGKRIVTYSFWDTETSGQSNSIVGTGKTTAEMQTATTFLEAGWDFVDETANGTEDIWWILEGQSYPRLWWQFWAFSPYPQDGATDVVQPLILHWKRGISAQYHDVYFGEDEEVVADATIESPEIYRGRQPIEMTTYDPGTLDIDKTYYWRIDEVNQADPDSPWKGDVWCFTTSNFIIVDDFESYSAENPISRHWNGWHYNPWDPGYAPYFASNGTGAVVGDETTASGCEEVIVHGGSQSMPFTYDNNKTGFAKYSETELTLIVPRDWTEEGVSELSLWFHGRPASVGSFVEEPVGTYTMTGSGTNVGDQYDQFHYAFKTLSGSGTIVAKVESIENTHEWAKAGVMIRKWLDSYSQYVFVCVTPSNGVAFQGRGDEPETSFTTNQTGINTPHWIKLERDAAGNFMASHSANGTAWQPVQNAGQMNISMSSNVYIGLALTAHNADATCQAMFSNITITGTVSAQWAHQDIGIIYNDAEPLYVAVSNIVGLPAIVVHDDPTAAQIDTWTEWVIPLSAFADQGIVLTNVDRLAIGLGTMGNMTVPGGKGKMFFDDIRLYRLLP